jgi:primosomal protein N' (replication factor Y)
VAVAVNLPRLELDRPFTYLAPTGISAGHVVSVPFHGRTVKGWVLGPTDDVPGRVLAVRRVLSPVPVFRAGDLPLYRWMAERYVAPLATVIDRAVLPRVASEEGRPVPAPAPVPSPEVEAVLPAYEGGAELLAAAGEGSGAFVVRPLPDEEALACVEAVAACLAGGRDAVVAVPEAEPLPHTARAVADAFGPAALTLVGGEPRHRYRAWLELLGDRYRVAVGTRPVVFAPVRKLGLVWVHREAHPGHREERAPYHHVRDVALARARLGGAVCVLAGLSPSADGALLADRGAAALVRPARQRERAAAPLVETARPEGEDRSPRLTEALKAGRGAFLLLSRRGAGVARVCRVCGEPARCADCAGPLVVRERRVACAVCGAEGICPSCGGRDFGVERGGTERLQDWAARVAGAPVARVEEGGRARPPAPDGVVVGTAAAVKDFGPRRTGLVAILDPDRGLRRAGLTAPEQALATWMEAATWAGPRRDGGRVLVQTHDPSHRAVQALVRWDPWVFHRAERRRRAEAGFPPGHPVFRILGTDALGPELEALRPVHLLSTSLGEQAVCLVTVRPDAVAALRARLVSLAESGVVQRVEAEPHL